jgi:hypothetical protein
MYTKEQKYLCARYAMLGVLNGSIEQKDYSCLQQLYELIHIDNRKLVQRLHEHRFICLSPRETIFTDMAYIIFEESENNNAILESFYSFYSKKFPDIILKLKKAESLYEKNHSPYTDLIKSNIQHRQQFELFVLFYSDVIWDIEIYGIDFSSFCRAEQYGLLTSDHYKLDNFRFNTGESIFTSKQYERYVSKRKEELALAASKTFNDPNIKADNIAQVLGEILRSKSTDKSTPMSPLLDGIVTGTARDILIDQHCGAAWYEQVTVTSRQRSGYSLGYRPNVDELIDIYYKNVVTTAYARLLKETGEQMSMLYLARKCMSESPLVDLYAIMYMYNLSIFSKLFTVSMEDYYRNFSWEKITQQALSVRYENIISALEAQMKVCLEKVSSLAEQNQMLLAQMSKKIDSDILPYERSIADFANKLNAKDEEISSLKIQLASKEKYIELLLSADDPDVQEEINLDELKQKRYLFVGAAKEALPQLRKEFPNSLFMETEGYSLKNIKVDGVVMLIKYMSHAMFYKVNSTAALTNIPIVRCNTKNINTIYHTMSTIL